MKMMTNLFSPFDPSTSKNLALNWIIIVFPIILIIMLLGRMKNFLSMMEHLLPQGTPNLPMPFMVCIELVSNIIRPITLSIRLTANMIAEHLLLTLLGNSSLEVKNCSPLTSIFSQLTLMILEAAAAVIQSYVFTILCTLYSTDV